MNGYYKNTHALFNFSVVLLINGRRKAPAQRKSCFLKTISERLLRKFLSNLLHCFFFYHHFLTKISLNNSPNSSKEHFLMDVFFSLGSTDSQKYLPRPDFIYVPALINTEMGHFLHYFPKTCRQWEEEFRISKILQAWYEIRVSKAFSLTNKSMFYL